MPSAWRIVPEHRAATAFDGEGARLYGGRWNSPGHAAVYTAGSRALAALEILVHLTRPQFQLRYALIEIHFEKSHLEIAPNLPELYSPTIDPSTQQAGDFWIQNHASPVLRIGSSIIADEPNYLINPSHPDFAQLKIDQPTPFAFDPRLLDK